MKRQRERVLERVLRAGESPFDAALHVVIGTVERDGGLPLSFQLVGKRFDDATVLRAAHTYEQATPWRGRRPAL